MENKDKEDEEGITLNSTGDAEPAAVADNPDSAMKALVKSYQSFN